MLLKTLTVFILVTPLCSSHAETKKVRLHNNPAAMKNEVLKKIPIGSSIEHAKEVMEKSGFKCEMKWNGSFAYYDDKGNQQATRNGEDYLYCDKEKSAFPFILLQTRRWQIAIVHKNGVVTEAVVAISLTGP